MIFGLQNTGLINTQKALYQTARHPIRYGLFMFGCLSLLVLSSCENSLKQIREISDKEVTKPVQRTVGVEMIYSDSAKVKARMLTPLLLQYKPTDSVQKSYDEMPKGVKIISFDKGLQPNSTITSEYAIRRESEHLVELRKNVVATNAKGDVFKSDELIWNNATQKVTSSKPVTITLTDGTVIYGDGLETNSKFDPWTIPNTTGKFNVNSNISQQ
ncbi:LPS export ABC transporter periplasmic protein LptC [Mucilaginibacter lacusdianchii]|uniref:LPS export ABC transporter periplasmic protein LptC n=1 Tax=Mucilaginibacter lacusdianchii TaxID=2684211 RepID=UPI00131C9948|nr:LPS export ABC transporter periplasmic protein LptC [Mucilaginibacter sp. JXJ CY 39]